MKIGDKFKEGYLLLEKGDWQGLLRVYEAVTNLYQLDALDEIIYDKLTTYVRGCDMSGENTEANQWIKILLMDSRFAGLLLRKGDLLENLVDVFNKLPEVEDDYVTDSFMEGSLSKVKYADGAFYFVEKDYLKRQCFLIRRENGVNAPLDFDVEDFTINRQEKRIEFSYIRGSKAKFSVDYLGNDKKILSGQIDHEE